jgi:hypothetical protein
MAWARRSGGSKYGAIRTEYAGVSYASKSEAAYAATLDLLIKSGNVRWWIGQPKFRLGCPENVYVPDMLVVPAVGDPYVVDVKGVRTAKFNKDVRLWAAYGPCDLHIVSGKKVEVVQGRGGGWIQDRTPNGE